MSFDPVLTRAKFEQGIILPEELPAFCADALEAGFDGASVRVIAGLIKPTYRDFESYIGTLWKELGIPILGRREAAIVTARDLAKKVLAKPSTSRDLETAFWYLWMGNDYWGELWPLAEVHEYRDCVYDNAEADCQLIEACESFLERTTAEGTILVPTAKSP